MKRVLRIFVIITISLAWTGYVSAEQKRIDFSNSLLIIPAKMTSVENEAVRMLIEEVEKRSQIRMSWKTEWLPTDAPKIVIGSYSELQSSGFPLSLPPADLFPREGYRLWIDRQQDQPTLVIAGNDERGVLFGVGLMLRALHMKKKQIELAGDFQITSAPRYPLHGHQLGYRPKTNSYDGWTLAQFEQYIRDLIVFGANAVELIPPRSDDEPDSPHFPLPQMETMIGMSEICARYGLDVWIWYPALDADYSDPKTVEFALQEWGAVFKKLPKVDAVFVPCGDPGGTPPELLLPMIAKQAEQLRQIHPSAQWWIGPQGFDPQRLQTFLELIQKNPPWLAGIVYGPWTRMTLPQFRQWAPANYPIRHYPDITHSIYCQFPVPEWDPAFSQTEGREVINPRPMDEAHIIRVTQPDTIGFIAYSEGCNDDVNKIVWSRLAWNPDEKVIDILRDYSRYFIGPDYEDSFAQGLLALERNWQGSALANKQIDKTLQQFQAMEETAPPQVLLNWRFQQGLFRAYYDAFVRQRLIFETGLENQAMSVLKDVDRTGTLIAISEAKSILQKAVTEPAADRLRQRVLALGEDLFQSIRMQLDTQHYRAGRSDGAVLDRIDAPLNNRLWLVQELDKAAALPSEKERLVAIDRMVNWSNPGPGGFYDDLGDPANEPHLILGKGFTGDPFYYATVRHNPDFLEGDIQTYPPSSWMTLAVTLYDFPMQMKYDDLDPSAQYKVRVVYANGPVRLLADDQYEVHPFLDKRYQVVEFDIPQEATADGQLLLTFKKPQGIDHGGRRNEICEVWLMKK